MNNRFVRESVSPADDDNGWADETTITLFGQPAASGWKFPRSRVKRIVTVQPDGKGGRTPTIAIKAVPTVGEVVRALVNDGASSVADVKACWARLRRKGAIAAAWGQDCDQIARKLLKVRR